MMSPHCIADSRSHIIWQHVDIQGWLGNESNPLCQESLPLLGGLIYFLMLFQQCPTSAKNNVAQLAAKENRIHTFPYELMTELLVNSAKEVMLLLQAVCLSVCEQDCTKAS